MTIGDELRAGSELCALREEAHHIIQVMAQNYEEHGETALDQLEWLAENLKQAIQELRDELARGSLA